MPVKIKRKQPLKKICELHTLQGGDWFELLETTYIKVQTTPEKKAEHAVLCLKDGVVSHLNARMDVQLLTAIVEVWDVYHT